MFYRKKYNKSKEYIFLNKMLISEIPYNTPKNFIKNLISYFFPFQNEL